MSTGTAHSAEGTKNNAVNALCSVVQWASHPMWVVTSTSGIDPRHLGELTSGNVVVTHPGKDAPTIRTIEGRVSDAALNASILAVSHFVEALCASDEE